MWGGINGYVKLPDGHPWIELQLQIDADDVVDVHGGVTFGPAYGNWIGFDTMHAGDIWADSPETMKFGTTSWDKHWTQDLVIEETKRLARQVANAQ